MIRTAVVGVGYLGTFHAEKMYRSKQAELVAVVDTAADRAKECAKRFKCKALTDYRELPALGVQAVSVVSNTSTHHEVAAFLLANGIDVLVEKPMTVTAAEGRELIELAHRESRVLQVGHLERFNPAFRAMKRVLSRPYFFEMRRIAQFVGRGHDVDVVRDLMIHDIDIISHLVGRPLERVEAIGVPVLTNSVDVANARLTFEGGAIANVTASRAAFKSERSIRVFQPDLYISLDFAAKKLKVYQRGEGTDRFGFPKISVEEHRVEERDALEHEIESFLNAVATRSEPEVTGEDGLRALELVERIHEAFRQSISRFDEPDPELLKLFAAAAAEDNEVRI